MDVKCAFLNGDLEEEFCIEQPDGFSLLDDKNMVCGLKKSLYGFKQAPRAWYARLDKYLLTLAFTKGNACWHYNKLGDCWHYNKFDG